MSKVVDIYPNEVIERKENEAETAAKEELAAIIEAKQADEAAKAAAKASALSKLGLTAEELAAVLA